MYREASLLATTKTIYEDSLNAQLDVCTSLIDEEKWAE
jgi:hypothetical protein